MGHYNNTLKRLTELTEAKSNFEDDEEAYNAKFEE